MVLDDEGADKQKAQADRGDDEGRGPQCYRQVRKNDVEDLFMAFLFLPGILFFSLGHRECSKYISIRAEM